MSADGRLAQWLHAAETRHAHLPPGEARDWRIQRTLRAIRDEAELVALRLPDLDAEERCSLLEEATLDITSRHGFPVTDVEEALFDARVSDLFERMQLAAREQKAPVAVRAKLITRRLMRRWSA